jgi:carboxylate-amine ligase
LSGELWSVSQRSLVPAQAAIAELWRELEPDLRAHGEAETLHPLLEQLLARGTSATRQRHVFGSTGDLHAVVRDAIELTHAAATARPAAAKAAPASQPL